MGMPEEKKVRVPEGLFIRCGVCREVLFRKEFERNYRVCPACGYHFRIDARRRIELLLDDGKIKEMDAGLKSKDPLGFVGKKSYLESVKEASLKTGLNEAVITGKGRIDGIGVFFGCFDFQFIGGSMGSVVGEKVTRLFEKAAKEKKPVVMVVASGGARMQEGVISLFQMAKTVASVSSFEAVKKPFIVVFTHPTMGGVTASFSSLADIILAEPGALIGFTGPRVIEQTIKHRLPKGFQTAEFLVERGMIDRVVKRLDLKEEIAKILRLLGEA
jgi:acetyl-CoA carboxylase carboxyl transferase subunit beta